MPAESITVRRFDESSTFDRFEKNGAGGLKLPVRCARTGIQVYKDSQGSLVREYRAPEEVFSEDSLQSLSSVPVTIGHPVGGVTPDTWKLHSVGHVSEMPTERTKLDGQEWIESKAYVTDAQAMTKVAAKDLREVSMGYSVEVVFDSGVTPTGEPYDARQTNIRYNHLALLPRGGARAGREARLTIDGHQDCPQESSEMAVKLDEKGSTAAPIVIKMVTFDGVEYERGSDKHVDALNAKLVESDKAQAKADADIEKLTKDLATAKADASDGSRIDAAISFRDSARKLLGNDYSFEGKTDAQVRKDAVTKVAPECKLDGKSDTYVECRYDMAVSSYVDVKSDNVNKEDTAEDRFDENLGYIGKEDSAESKRMNAGFAASFAQENK